MNTSMQILPLWASSKTEPANQRDWRSLQTSRCLWKCCLPLNSTKLRVFRSWFRVLNMQLKVPRVEMDSLFTGSFFFSKDAGELRFIILRRREGKIPQKKIQEKHTQLNQTHTTTRNLARTHSHTHPLNPRIPKKQTRPWQERTT